jgi:hypothetical protein
MVDPPKNAIQALSDKDLEEIILKSVRVNPDLDLSAEGESIREHVADQRADRWLRIIMAIALTALFIGLNGAVVCMVRSAVSHDLEMLAAKTITADQRLITEKVYLALIGGTVAQVAAIVVAMARYLFPSRKDGD